MALTESRKDYIKNYNNKNYDEFKIRLPKGYKDRIKKHIGDDESMNTFFKRAVDAAMLSDKK